MRRRFISLNDVVYYDYNDYMTIEALEDGVIIKTPRDVEYGINGVGWKKLKKDYSLSLTKGQFISFKCYLSSESFGTIKITGGKCYLRGNCLSLIHGDRKDLSIHTEAFCNLFKNNNSIIGSEVSFLRATTLADYCYYLMFESCTSLTNAPELPATTLANNCYSNMFNGCTSLTNAPELPATTLAKYCYEYMFNGCKKLNYIKMLATDISASRCLYDWVSGVATTGTFVKNPAMTTIPTGTDGIPSGWTVVNDEEESGGDLITFYIADSVGLRPNFIEYTATEGMTWGEWINSEYNTSDLYIDGEFVITSDGLAITSSVGSSVRSSYVIINGEQYRRG